MRQLKRILIADDHKLVRQGIRRLLEAEADFEIVGEANDGVEAVEKTAELKPDILITDLKMPRLGGIKVTERVRESSPDTRIIILSMYQEKAYVAAALNAGARGYVLKKSSTDVLVDAIRAVARGQRFLSPPLLEEAL